MRSLTWILCCIQAQALACGPCLSYAAAMLGPCLSLLLCSSAQSCTLLILTLPCRLSFQAAAWTCPVPTDSPGGHWTVTDPGCHPWDCPLSCLGSCQTCLVQPLALLPRWHPQLLAHLPSQLPDMACSSKSFSLNSFLPQG